MLFGVLLVAFRRVVTIARSDLVGGAWWGSVRKARPCRSLKPLELDLVSPNTSGEHGIQ